MLDEQSSSVPEGDGASVCITLDSNAASLGCNLSVDLTTSDDSAGIWPVSF